MVQRVLLFYFSIFLLVSCAHTSVKKTIGDHLASMNGSVLDEMLLSEGGDLALTPFKAGPMAEANDELDHLSMMILKGVKESLDEQKTSLHIIAESQGKPKIAFEGYIQELSRTNRFSRMMMRPNRSSLVLVGDLWLISTGKRLLTFSIERKFNSKKENFTNVAYEMGKDIGKFIAAKSQLKEK